MLSIPFVGFVGVLVVILLLVLPALSVYTYRRFYRDLLPPPAAKPGSASACCLGKFDFQRPSARYAAGSAVAALWVLLVVAFASSRLTSLVGPERSALALGAWFGTLLWAYAMLLMAFADALLALLRLALRLSSGRAPRSASLLARWPAKHVLARAKCALVLPTALVVVLWGFVVAAQPGVLVTYDITLSRLPPRLDGVSIAVLVDLHAGITVSKAQVQASLDAAMAAKPDLVALVGDLMDGPIDKLSESVGVLQGCTAGEFLFAMFLFYFFLKILWLISFVFSMRLQTVSSISKKRMFSRFRQSFIYFRRCGQLDEIH